jgi:hypothetical protein
VRARLTSFDNPVYTTGAAGSGSPRVYYSEPAAAQMNMYDECKQQQARPSSFDNPAYGAGTAGSGSPSVYYSEPAAAQMEVYDEGKQQRARLSSFDNPVYGGASATPTPTLQMVTEVYVDTSAAATWGIAGGVGPGVAAGGDANAIYAVPYDPRSAPAGGSCGAAEEIYPWWYGRKLSNGVGPARIYEDATGAAFPTFVERGGGEYAQVVGSQLYSTQAAAPRHARTPTATARSNGTAQREAMEEVNNGEMEI